MDFIALLQNSSLAEPMVEGFRDTGYSPHAGLMSQEPGPSRYNLRIPTTIRLARNTTPPAWTVYTPPVATVPEKEEAEETEETKEVLPENSAE